MNAGQRKSCLIWAVPLGCLVVVLGCAGVCSGFIFTVFGALKGIEPYQMALERVQNSPRAKQLLGEPIRDGWVVSGSFSVQNDTGDADITFAVSGSKDSGNVHVIANRAGGKWTITNLTLDTKNESVDLTEPLAESPQLE